MDNSEESKDYSSPRCSVSMWRTFRFCTIDSRLVPVECNTIVIMCINGKQVATVDGYIVNYMMADELLRRAAYRNLIYLNKVP
jgi:hypothetical protein